MARVRVSLDSVLCAAKEDVTGPDEFYVAGAVGETTHDNVDPQKAAVLTVPLKMRADSDLAFGRGGKVVFDADLPATSTLRIELGTYEEDVAKDWDEYSRFFGSVGDVVEDWVPGSGEIIKDVKAVLKEVWLLDTDDPLGDIVRDLPVSQLPLGNNREVAVIEGTHNGSHYRYMVNYTVAVGDDPLPQAQRVMIKVNRNENVLDIARAEHRNDAPLIQYRRHGRSNQQFWLEAVGDDYYRIVAKHSGKCLTPRYGSLTPGTPVVQWTYEGGDYQKWKKEPWAGQGANGVRFQNKASGLYLGLHNRGAVEMRTAFGLTVREPLEISEDRSEVEPEDQSWQYQVFDLLAP